jgi:chaperonin GroEL (HSP60 family)
MPLLPSALQVMISGAKTSRAATLLLRGANDMHLDEMDRSLHDALCVVKRVLESGSVVPGGQGSKAIGCSSLVFGGSKVCVLVCFGLHPCTLNRSLHNALCVVKRVLESGSVVPGKA